jgi:putative ABC transport system substrate-binding protein
MAEELVRLPVDVIVADRPAVLFAQEATRTIPIIGAVSRDPVATGLIRSFAYPAAISQAFTHFGVELSAKRLQLLKEACHGISHLAAEMNWTERLARPREE